MISINFFNDLIFKFLDNLQKKLHYQHLPTCSVAIIRFEITELKEADMPMV